MKIKNIGIESEKYQFTFHVMMRRNAILIHGCCEKDEFFSDAHPSLSNAHWFPWLQKQLIQAGIETQTPEMPKPHAPEYMEWKRVFEQFDIYPETILIGHSCGAGFLLRWLSENNKSVKQLVLVAPWLDLANKKKGFLDFEINSFIQNRIVDISILLSTDEPVNGVKESVEKICTHLPNAKLYTFHNMGHFTFDEMKTNRFSELLKLIL